MRIEMFLEKYDGTCSINNLKPNHVTFIRYYEYTTKLKNVIFPLAVLTPNTYSCASYDHVPDNVRFYFCDDVDYEFTLLHNAFLNQYDGFSTINKISDYSDVHSTLQICDGIKVAVGPNKEKIQFIHTGNVVIEDDVEIGPYCVIHRGTMDSTYIRKGVKIGAHCNIGHNNDIGENTVIAAGVMLSGSIKVGKNCWLGTGSSYRQGISICDDVLIGVGSVVTKDITKPGVYVGNPAKFLRKLSGPKGWDS